MRALYLLLLPLLLFAACSSDEGGTSPIADNVTLTIGTAGGIATRAYGDDDNGREHEFIHTLHVFLVNSSGTIVWSHSYTAAELGSSAVEGNLTEKSISEITNIASGSGYTIYAFANFENCYATDNSTTTIDERIRSCTTRAQLNAICNLAVVDPAGQVDFDNGKYIPMAVKQTGITISNNSSLRVEMIRLVARVDVGVVNMRKTNIAFSSFTMSSFAGGVTVLADGTATLPTTTTSREITFSTPVTVPASTSTAQEITYFYVNATAESGTHDVFTVVPKLVDDDTNYSGATTRTTLPRNSILPITLRFSEYDVDFDIEALIAPIGGYPIDAYKVTPVTEDFVVALPEGCTFTITPTLQRNNGIQVTVDNGATYAWTVPTTVPDWFTYSLTGKTLSGMVSAEAGLTFADDQAFTLVTTGSNGKTYTNRLRFKTYAIDNTTK